MEIIEPYQFYCNKAVKWHDAKAQAQANGGHIFAVIVLEKAKGHKEKSLNFGFFFRSHAGEFFDVLKTANSELKTAHRTPIVETALLDVYPHASHIIIPTLSELNLITRENCKKEIQKCWNTIAPIYDAIAKVEVKK